MSSPPSVSPRRSEWESAEPPFARGAALPDPIARIPDPGLVAANDEDAPSPEPFCPSEAWLDAYERQSTAAMMEKAEAYARDRMRIVNLPEDAVSAEDLVQWAVLETLDGTYVWDPERVALLFHVRGLIWWRARDLARHRAKFRPFSVQAGADDAERAEAEEGKDTGNAVENEASLRADEPGDVRDRMAELLDRKADDERGARVGVELAAQLERAGDADAAAILDAYRAGITKAAEVMELADLTEKRYHNAHRRLLRLAQKLPAELREGPTPSTPRNAS